MYKKYGRHKCLIDLSRNQYDFVSRLAISKEDPNKQTKKLVTNSNFLGALAF